MADSSGSKAPDLTLGVAFEFPDYHKVSDSWDKIDYDNMSMFSATSPNI